MKHGIDFQYDVKSVIKAKEIVYYGWDFSNFRITDASKINDTELILKKHIPTWIGMLNARYPSAKVAEHFNKQVIENLVSVQNLIKNIKSDDLVTFQTYELTIDSVKNIVKSYILPEKTGIGLVFIIESFNKPQRYVTGFTTFFNIQNKEVLWSTKIKGLPGSKYGFIQYLYEGFIEIYDLYLSNFYKKQIKLYK